MGRRRGRGKLPPFVPITWEMINSKAWAKLTPSAGKLLPLFIGKSGFPKNVIGTVFSFTYSEAQNRYKVSRATFARVINELNDKGFIDIAGYGGLRGFCKVENKFKLSARWIRHGEADFTALPRIDNEKIEQERF